MKNIKPKKHHQSKYFTLMLVPYSSQKTKSIRIPHNFIKAAAALSIAILLFVGFSYVRVNFYKDSLDNAIEKTWQLIEEKDATTQNIKKQKEYIQQKEKDYNNKLSDYEKELRQYEEKAKELEDKIQELDKQKEDIYNLLSKKVGKDIKVANTYNKANIALASQSKQYTFLSSTILLNSNQNSNTQENPFNLNKKYSSLEQKITDEKNDYNTLMEQVKKYKPFLDAKPTTWPVIGKVTSGFGYRPNPISGYGREFHGGLDIKLSVGTPVKATGAGKVTFAGYQGGYGNVVIINHGYNLETRYAHNSKLAVSVGDTVNRGQVISYGGSTGRSTGPHLHYEVRESGNPVNPMNYID